MAEQINALSNKVASLEGVVDDLMGGGMGEKKTPGSVGKDFFQDKLCQGMEGKIGEDEDGNNNIAITKTGQKSFDYYSFGVFPPLAIYKWTVKLVDAGEDMSGMVFGIIRDSPKRLRLEFSDFQKFGNIPFFGFSANGISFKMGSHSPNPIFYSLFYDSKVLTF